MIVDVHCHLDHRDFADDIDEVIERARSAGVKAIITHGIDPQTNRAALKLAEKYDIVKAALGIYPPDALRKEADSGEYPIDTGNFDIEKEIDFIRSNKDNIVAIGECGLDFVDVTDSEKEQQIELFKRMIALAEEMKLPIVIHSRKGEQEVMDILKDSTIKKVLLHCFCGKKRLVKEAAERGYMLSIPTHVVRAQNFQQVVKEVNLSQLLTETDAPYLSPYKGDRNEPAFIVETIKKIAEIKGMDEQEVGKNIFMNYQRFF